MTPGRLRHPSSATSCSWDDHSSRGFTTATSGASAPARYTSTLCMTPSWVAARPTPSASDISPSIRAISVLRDSSNSTTSRAAVRSAGSPKTRIWASAARRRSVTSGSTNSSSSTCSSSTLCGSLFWLTWASLLWVDVDAQRCSGRLLAASKRPCNSIANSGHRRAPLGRLDQEPAPVAALEPEQRSRAKDGQVISEGGFHVERSLVRDRLGHRTGDHLDQLRKRRVAERAAALELLGHERAGVVAPGMPKAGGLGGERLNDDAPSPLPTAAAARELRNERESALLGTEVGEPQSRVSVLHDGERDFRKVVALSHHLSPDQNAAVGLLEAMKHLGDAAFAPCRIGV